MLDGSLAKGLVRDEVRSLSREQVRAMEAVINAVEAETEKAFMQQKRLDGQALKRLAESIHSSAAQGLAPARQRAILQPPTAARPKGEIYESSFVCTWAFHIEGRQDRLFGLFGFRMHATRKRVEIYLTHLGVTFREHAARRLLQREGVDAEERAVVSISRAIAENAAMLLWQTGFAIAKGGEPRLAIPFSHGLLLGSAVPTRTSAPSAHRYLYDRNGMRKIEVPGPPAFSETAIKTFVGGERLGCSQRWLRDELLLWADSHAEAIRAMNDAIFWPGATLMEEGLAERSEDELERMFASAEADLMQVLERAYAAAVLRPPRGDVEENEISEQPASAA